MFISAVMHSRELVLYPNMRAILEGMKYSQIRRLDLSDKLAKGYYNCNQLRS